MSFTKQSALAHAKVWIDNRMEAPPDKWTFLQKRWLMEELAVLCVVKTLQEGDHEERLNERLGDAYSLLNEIQFCVRPQSFEGLWAGRSGGDPRAEAAAVMAEHLVWKRHDPIRAFQEGLDSEHMPHVDKDGLIRACADYLQRPWLRHPIIDWILVDILITTEITSFGEHIKERLFPFAKNGLGVNDSYLTCRGNFDKMDEIARSELRDRAILRIFLGFVAPISAIIGAFYFGWMGPAVVLTGLYGVFVAGLIAVKLAQGVRRRFGTPRPDPDAVAVALWSEMHKVWQSLEGPVVNPTLIRELLVKSQDKGAAWEMSVYSLIDRTITVDPAVWVVRQSH